MEALAIKKTLLEICNIKTKERFNTVQQLISGIVVSLNEATKSSAGDKHETTRAMLQIEREQAGSQLAEIETVQQLLKKIEHTVTSKHIHLGSLVTTTQESFYMSISVGAVEVANKRYYCIGLQTPIGKQLLGKQVGDFFLFNSKKYTILDVA